MFLGFYNTDSTTSKILTDIILDILHRFDLSTSNIRGQCYDGAANMSGIFNGVQARILEIEEKAFFVHCTAHNLNLVVQDSVKSITECRDTLNIIKDLINFIKDSPRRLAIFKGTYYNRQKNLYSLFSFFYFNTITIYYLFFVLLCYFNVQV